MDTKHTPDPQLPPTSRETLHKMLLKCHSALDFRTAERDRLAAVNKELVAALEAVTEGDHGVCRFDHLNPCWDNRPSDVAGKHWGVGDACPACAARAAIAKAKGG